MLTKNPTAIKMTGAITPTKTLWISVSRQLELLRRAL
jgi:hypothetical protein